MLRITKSFLEDELGPLWKIFTVDDIRTAYTKAKKWLGESLGWKHPANSKLIKVYLTSKTSPARILFAFFVMKDIWIPVLLRSKNDKVWENLSPANKFYESALLRAFDRIEDDIINKKFEDFT